MIFLVSIGSALLEISVFNEELILLVCFIAFFVNAYCYASVSLHKSISVQANAIKYQIFDNQSVIVAYKTKLSQKNAYSWYCSDKYRLLKLT